MKEEVKVGAGVMTIGLVAVLGISALSYGLYAFYSPKYAAVDNATFHESQAYNDGMVRDLENLQLEYVNADATKKDSIRAIVLHRFSVYPEDKMPPNLRNFYNQLRNGN